METTASVMSSTASLYHEAKFEDVKGINTRYYEVGEGEPMLLIHGAVFGGTGSANTWTRNLSGLGKSFHVYAPDRVGSGMTDNPKNDDFSFQAVVQHLYDFSQTMGLKTAHIVGQSLGAFLATRFSLEHPEVAKSLVIVDTASLAPEVGSQAERLAKVNENKPSGVKEYIRFYWERMSYSPDHVTDDYVDAGYFMETLPKSQDTKRKLAAGGNALWTKTMNAQKEETLQWIKEGRLQLPTLMFWSANDPTAILAQGLLLFDAIREHNHRTRMHIVNHAGHFPYREYPEEFSAVVTNFIQQS